MVDRYFPDSQSALLKDGWQVAVHAIEGGEERNGRGGEGFEGTTGIPDSVANEEPADAIGGSRGDAAAEGIPAFFPEAANDVDLHLSAGCKQAGDVRWIVLAIAIKGHTKGTAGVAQTQKKGSGLAPIFGKPEANDVWGGANDIPGLVGAAIIDGDDLGAGASLFDFSEDSFHVGSLVVERDDDGTV